MEKNDMEKSGKGLIIAIIIVLIVLILCLLYVTGMINFNDSDNRNEGSSTKTVEKNDKDNKKEEISREEIVSKLKESLNNQEWVQENLYPKVNCFGEEIRNIDHHFTFTLVQDKNNNPIVVVLEKDDENFILACYRVFYNGEKIIAESITGNTEHPANVYFKVDKEQGLVLYNWAHMGEYSFISFDIKDKKINVYDRYNCDDDCPYEYKGDKTYNPSDISIDLNESNIETYIK